VNDPSTSIIIVNNVIKQFGRFAALRGVTAEFDAGQFHAILGENGAGKTTLLRALAGLAQRQPPLLEHLLDLVERFLAEVAHLDNLVFGHVEEFGDLRNPRALEEFARKGEAAHLERDMGLGSLERVELMLRLDNAFSIHLPEKVVAEADTAADLLEAVLQQLSSSPNDVSTDDSRVPSTSRIRDFRPAIPGEMRRNLLEELARAKTLTDVFRIRARLDPATEHIHLYEEDGKVRTITCAELFTRASAVAAMIMS